MWKNRRRKVAVDVEHHIGRVAGIDADCSLAPPGTMAALALMRPSSEFMVDTKGWSTRRPDGQIPKRPLRHHGDVQRISRRRGKV